MKHHMKNAVACAECAFLSSCGGLSGQSSVFGCFSECILNCDLETCDLTCPNNPRLFANRLMEIEGTFEASASVFNIPKMKLPEFVPKIHNGSGRLKALRIPVAAIPIRELLRKSGSNISCRFNNPSQVRHYFRLSNRTAFIISCISDDEVIEMVWMALRYGRLAEELARLKPAAIIVPNFSFFTDVPRPHTLYNRKRIYLATRILSKAGCRVILPLSALTPDDWDFWYKLLQDNPTMKYVAKEFQTGLSNPVLAMQAIAHLSELQKRLGRSLHPIALGGSVYSNLLDTHFNNYTIVESRSFFLAVNRRQALQGGSGLYSEVPSPTAPGEAIDELLASNIRVRRRRLKHLRSNVRHFHRTGNIHK